MNRLPRRSMHSTIALLYAMFSTEPAPAVCPLVLPPPLHDNEKLRAAKAKRARRAAKWRKEGRP